MRLRLSTAAACVVATALGSSLSLAQAPVPAPPEGASEQVTRGSKLYQEYCALCHGAKGRDASVFPRPIWGAGHDIAKFGDAKGLFEYLQLLMPFDNPAKINDNDKAAIVAYILVRNGTLKAGDTLPVGGNQTKIK
jgi:polar amino acid transport system substrate-binding protein